jgi:hypothetical protein
LQDNHLDQIIGQLDVYFHHVVRTFSQSVARAFRNWKWHTTASPLALGLMSYLN